MGMTRDLSSGRSRPGVDVPAPAAIGALLAPVVACLRGDDNGVRDAVRGRLRGRDGPRRAASRTRRGAGLPAPRAPAATAPTASSRATSAGALDRFGDREVVAIGAECLEVARADAALAPIANAVFVDAALDHGRWCALVGAVASCWWCAERGAALRGTDAVEETAAICRYLASVA